MDWKFEYEKLIRGELLNLGCNRQLTDNQLKRSDRRDQSITDSLKDYELSLLSQFFYSVVNRLFVTEPREIVEYSNFDYKGNDVGITRLKKKIIEGDNLVPHLSKRIFEVDQARMNDPMLNEWGIYHFHVPDIDGNGWFVKRTDDLLFAIVTEGQFIFIDINTHSSTTGTYEPWADLNIIEKIEDHYPELLSQYYVGDGKTPLTSEQRQNLRVKNCNTNIITTKGREYRHPGLGTVSAGLPIQSIVYSDMAMDLVDRLEEANKNSGLLLFDGSYRLIYQQ